MEWIVRNEGFHKASIPSVVSLLFLMGKPIQVAVVHQKIRQAKASRLSHELLN